MSYNLSAVGGEAFFDTDKLRNLWLRSAEIGPHIPL